MCRLFSEPGAGPHEAIGLGEIVKVDRKIKAAGWWCVTAGQPSRSTGETIWNRTYISMCLYICNLCTSR